MELQKYIQSFENYFWEWESNLFSKEPGLDTIIIPDGKTIAYEKFVFEILEFLSDDSLPPFGSLLLVIIATNQESLDTIDDIFKLAKERINKEPFQKPDGNFFRASAAIDFLKILSSLPEEYKTGQKRLQLFQTIFHDCHNRISFEKTKKILQEYKINNAFVRRAKNKIPFNEANFIKDFRTIALLKTKFPTVQSVIKAMEELPQEKIKAELGDEVFEAQITDEPLDFIEELIREERTFQVGSLVKRIWSGLNIPLHHNMPSAQPLGGISDLTNKGDFDKLVISEFANDDDVFMSRIANNEALYIQREVPPEADKFERVLLIDTTLINWGNPKILGFASAIAVATHPKTDIQCKVFAVGDTYQEIHVENVHQVISALSEVSGKLTCAEGLDLFFSENSIDEKSQEVFFISSDESLKLQLMQKAMSDYFTSIKYVFVTNIEGSISIYKNQNKGKKLLQEIIMPLEELWRREEVTYDNFIFDINKDNSIPLLYPVERNYQNIFHNRDQYYLYVNGSLFLFNDEGFDKGFSKIASNLPFYMGEFAIRSNQKGELLLLNYSYGTSQNITVVNLTTNQSQKHKAFSEEQQNTKFSFFDYNQVFYFTNNINFWSVKSNCQIELNYDPMVVSAFDDYFTQQSLFVQNFKNNRSKYGIIKRLTNVSIENGQIRINNYLLEKCQLKKTTNRANRRNKFTAKGNLILKNRGQNALTVLKLIREKTGKTLKEAKEIVDQKMSVIYENVEISFAEDLKKRLESNGAVCYIETNCFESADGSRITIKDGILIFESSDKQLPLFYIPFIFDKNTILATAAEYTGNTYFVSKELAQECIEYELFEQKYLNPFISKIVEYGA